jgi:hypothetical protein
MPVRKKLIITLILIVMCLLVHWYSADADRVENGYSLTFFPFISSILRRIFGFIPFSIGDILYGIAAIFLAVKVFHLFRFIFSKKRRQQSGEKIRSTLLSVINVLCVIYLAFNIFWGINYNRKGIAAQIGLEVNKYSVEDLKQINAVLVEKINSSKAALDSQHTAYPDNRELFRKVAQAYDQAAKKYPFLKYDHPSMKSSMWGWFGNYTGFTGYYNPFTGEAQVNTGVPKFTQPYTACHEAAHALGYAKEMEANFTGYLAASASADTLFRYSVYTDLFLYANRSLYFADTAASAACRKQLLPSVVEDFKERARFSRTHASFMEPIVRALYGSYLQANRQPKGLWSYDEVTAFIISYYKKFGTI